MKKEKPKVAIIRGKFLNKYEMQIFEPLASKFNITAFGSLIPFHDKFNFPVVKLPSPMDLPDFPYKIPILNRLFIDAQYLFGLEEKLKGFDIAHSAESYYHYTQQCLNAKKKGYVKKVIATVLENIPFNNEGIWGRKNFKRRARLELDHIIALTNLTKKTLILEGADPSKITVISHGINTSAFQPKSKIKMQPFDFAQGKNSKLNEVNILFAGRLEYYKGVFDVARAAKILLNDKNLKSYKLTFTFVGNGTQKNKLLELEKELGIEKFIIHKEVAYSRIPDEYKQSDIFIAPSKPIPTYEEQYCTALLEAQAAGLPIVTTKSGGIPENVGDAAVLVEPGDYESMAQELKLFILNPKKRIEFSKKARKRAETVHDAKIIARKLSNLYESLI